LSEDANPPTSSSSFPCEIFDWSSHQQMVLKWRWDFWSNGICSIIMISNMTVVQAIFVLKNININNLRR